MAAVSRAPSSCRIMTAGIVIDASEPPIGTGGPASLFTTTTPTAPAFCAFLTLTTNVHRPRSSNAI